MQRPMASTARAALLIDADHFHHPDPFKAVHAQFAQHMGKHFVCHAQGSAQVLARQALKPLWQALAARLMPALPWPKNTTVCLGQLQ